MEYVKGGNKTYTSIGFILSQSFINEAFDIYQLC